MSPCCTSFLPKLFSARSRHSPSSDRNPSPSSDRNPSPSSDRNPSPSSDRNPSPSSDRNSFDSRISKLLDSVDTRSNSHSIQRYRYDVFISFRGSDTRHGFVGHLYAHLLRKGLMVFKDDIELRKGESISPQLLQAIQDSRVSIVVFSKDYASSTWCLDEMAAIYSSHLEIKQIVFPVFYDVDPSHVRKQNGVYEKDFRLLEIFKDDKVDGWKRAMAYLAGLAGCDVRNKPEFEEIKKIVQDVIKTLGHKFSSFADDLIGVQLRVEALKSQLRLSLEDDNFRVLGIWGMDGIGKTTLATVLYDTISHHYQFGACCFIENVSTIYRDGGAIAVQKQILLQTLKEKNLDVYTPSEISRIITNRLYNMKLLIVLDDVDQFEQLQELHINPKLLRPGSRIIITTRDVHILELYGADRIHEVELMNDNDAHELLCTKAFKSDYSSNDYAELIPKVLKYAQGLPLAIRVMGSFLYNRNTTQWRATLEGLKNNPDSGIMKVLQSSFEGLEGREKEIFLHVACFFEGEREDYVRRILDACELHPDIGIPVIAEKSLITITNQEIHMHKMLQELGKKNVRGQHADEPRLWSRLWYYGDLHDAMITKQGVVKAKAIILNQREDVRKFKKLRDEDLSKLENLKVLILSHSNFPASFKFLSDSLHYLLWNGCPLTYLPSNFAPYNLVELNMPDSSIVQLWEDIQYLPFLKRMDISNSKNLKVTPRFEGMRYLERLDLTGCINLSEVHPSIGLLEKLEFLSLQNCSSLVNLDFGNEAKLWSLKVLRLSDCKKLKNSPDCSGLFSLRYLDMDRCASLSTIHESVGALQNLKFVSLRDCANLIEMPDSLNTMRSLTTLDLCGCSKFNKLSIRHISTSPSMQSLIFLDLSFCNISEVPNAIGEFKCLERLNLQGNNLTELPSTFERLHNLSYLNLSHCHKLQNLPYLPAQSGPSNSMGRYFKTTSGSRNHRSGLYIFDSPNCMKYPFFDKYLYRYVIRWVKRLVTQPLHFRCGFDIVLPLGGTNDFDIQRYFYHRYKGGSIVRIIDSTTYVDWLGFLFYVTFELHNHNQHWPSSQLPHPFYLSFESEYTEERFDMPLNLESHMVDGLNYVWAIYISMEHCHFVKTGAHITFKARQGLIIKEWGLRVLTKEDTEDSICIPTTYLALEILESSGSSYEPKIQLPYNWLVSDEDEAEIDEVKGKETDLFNLSLLTERPQ